MSGEYIGQSQNGCLPNITGWIYDGYGSYMSMEASGAFYWSGSTARQARGEDSGSHPYITNFDASRSNSIYGNGWFSGTKVIPAGTGVSYIIKY